MSKFKVGDRVRGIADEDGKGKGCTGVVVEMNHYIVVDFDAPFEGWGDNGRWWGLPESSLEPAPKFAVGDRVRVVKLGNDRHGGGSGHGAKIGDTATLKEFTIGKFWRTNTFDFYEHEIEPAPLTIQAGRYYKTRDGRKVGPMISFYGNFIKAHGDDFVYAPDGRRDFVDTPNEDIIAEWVDEPAVAEAMFRIGDRVKFVDDYGGPARGEEATVVKLNVWGEGKGIQVDQGCMFGISTEHAHSLRLVSSSPAIVALIENGQPKPATRPFVHPDRANATKEARRLAGKHKGQEFGVYELVDTAKEAKVYEHEWQRLAAEAELIPAIKAYREAGGRRQTFIAADWFSPARYEDRHVIGLKEAKDAVEHWLSTEAA